MIYNYPYTSGDIVIMALKIEKGGLTVPDGMTLTGNEVGVIYNTPLTDPQKATLDSIMAQANLGDVPVTGNTVYTFDDPMDFRSVFKTATGLTFDIYPFGKSSYKIVFNKVLTNSDKTNLRNALLTLLKQIQ